MAKSAKSIRWGAYNRRRQTCDWYAEADRLKRIETRRQKDAQRTVALEAEHRKSVV